jgi:hypothetical protein
MSIPDLEVQWGRLVEAMPPGMPPHIIKLAKAFFHGGMYLCLAYVVKSAAADSKNPPGATLAATIAGLKEYLAAQGPSLTFEPGDKEEPE